MLFYKNMLMSRTSSFLKLVNSIIHLEIPWELTENYGFRKLSFYESKCQVSKEGLFFH